MGFTRLADRIGALPLVLAGPLVRRVEPSSVTIWIALRLPRAVTLELFPAAGGAAIATVTTPTIAIGHRLHMLAITASDPAIAAGQTYRYNLRFAAHPTETGVAGEDNVAPGDLLAPLVVAGNAAEARKRLVYDGGSAPADLPSVLVPSPDIERLRVLHASCRKIKKTSKDAFPAIDHLLGRHFAGAPTEPVRPAMLFLTGDQVYADGPSDTLIALLADAAPVLLGWDELLPVSNRLASELVPRVHLPFGIGLPTRQAYSVNDAGFVTPNFYSALAMGEIIALYLLQFAEVLWPPELAGEANGFPAGLVPTRRALANIATYMIFDDHEVANALFVNRDWAESVLGSALGRRVLGNALSAYALCQHWGNAPGEFVAGRPGGALLVALNGWTRDGGDGASAHLRDRDDALGVPASTPGDLRALDPVLHGPGKLDWHFTLRLPCKVRVYVLDPITSRSFPGTKWGAPDHLSGPLLQRQTTPAPEPDDACVLVVASNLVISRPPSRDDLFHAMDADAPSRSDAQYLIGLGAVAGLGLLAALYPMGLVIAGAAYLGWAIVGGGASPWTMVTRSMHPAHMEEKGWHFDWQSPAFERLLEHFTAIAPGSSGDGVRRVVLLSGDVHKSYAMKLEYERDGARAVFTQLVGSSLRYAATEASSYAEPRPQSFAGWTARPAVRGFDHKIWRGRGDEYGNVAKYTDATQFSAQPPVAWRYRITPISVVKQRAPVVSTPTGEETGRADWNKRLADLKTQRRKTIESVLDSDMIVANNVADVSFQQWNAGTLVQRVWWWFLEKPDAHDWIVSRYEVPIDHRPLDAVKTFP